jgi:hypothetical protein
VVETGARDKVGRVWGSAERELFRELAEQLAEIANGIDWHPLQLGGPPPPRIDIRCGHRAVKGRRSSTPNALAIGPMWVAERRRYR